MARAIHQAQIREHGGSLGLRDEGLLDSALDRPQHKFAHTPDSSIAELASAYVFGIAKNHPFVDGDRRTAFMVAYAFLGINGWDFEAPEPEAVAAVEGVAAGRISEREFAVWIQKGMSPADAY
jgi:death on curing protein